MRLDEENPVAAQLKDAAAKCYVIATDELQTDREQATWEAISTILNCLATLAERLNQRR